MKGNTISFLFNYKWIVFFELVFVVAVIFLLGITNSEKAVVILLSFILIIILALDFKLSYYFLILSLFLNFHFFTLSTAVVYSVYFLLIFLFVFKFTKKDFSNPLSRYFIIYLFLIVPSYFNSVDLLSSLLRSYNLIGFLIVVYITIVIIKSEKDIKQFLKFYLFLIFINSLYTIFQGLILKQRVYGFAGIMFVDYLGIAIVITLAYVLIYERMKVIELFFIGIMLFASFFTETRNPWITIFLCSILLLLYLYKNSQRFNLNRRRLIFILITAVIFIPLLYLTVKYLNPSISERTNISNFQHTFDYEGRVQNSLLSRIFIWDTAINAFIKNPIIGIGAFSFPFSSYQYYTIPKFLFELYVKGLSPHVTYLAVITETGIIGLIGFVLLIYNMIRISFKSIKISTTKEDLLLSTILSWSLIYIVISMLMTDAWLWGQGAILWGILLGLNLANFRLKLEA